MATVDQQPYQLTHGFPAGFAQQPDEARVPAVRAQGCEFAKAVAQLEQLILIRRWQVLA